MTENEQLEMIGIINRIKAEAYKEYHEKVKQKLLDKGFYPAIVKSAFDEVEKEMVDKEKESYNRR